MRRPRRPAIRAALAALAVAALFPAPAAASEPVRHKISAAIEPAAHLIRAVDRITLPPQAIAPDGSARFTLHGALHITDAGPGAVAMETPAGENATPGVPRAVYRVRMPEGDRRLVVAYEGLLSDPSADAETLGGIDREGVLLGGATHWYPQLAGPGEDALSTFEMTVQLPTGWDGVGQGARTRKDEGETHTVVAWREDQPQDEIYLVAAPFTVYVQPAGPTEGMVFLRRPDPLVADRYLTATARYVALYSKMLGPYPYAKFALVENSRETGFGMPSFTLMGPTVLRLPFIVDTSYPHEILHNWWGNGVFVKPGGGNWAEGLTVYLADHLLAEQKGNGVEYRRETLQRYADYVREGDDFPLTEFTARRDEVTQAVGYGKTMMLFHMLDTLEDVHLLQGLRAFYRDHQFTRAGWDDLTASISAAADRDLEPYMKAWLTTTGAPAFALDDARAVPEGDGYRLTATLRQTQGGTAYPVSVPLAVTLEGAPEAVWTVVSMDGAASDVALTFPARPLRVDVDPAFDVFRRLAPGEVPPALSGLLGAEKVTFVLPSKAPDDLLYAYGRLAAAWGRNGGTTVLDSELKALPADGPAVWVLGWDNAFARDAARAVAGRADLVLTDNGFVLDGETHRTADDSAVFAATAPGGSMLGWIAATRPDAVNGLARKLPHYGKYGFLVFTGDAPDNVVKGQWPPGDSALSVPVAGPDGKAIRVPRAALPERPALAPWPKQVP